jgi:hypothetical protein
MTEIYYCVNTKNRLDGSYCPDCNRLDCAVNLEELENFHIQLVK